MHLDPAVVSEALPRIGPGLTRYLDLQRRLYATDTAVDRDFQRAFNAFYRVRRNTAWQAVFYELLEREKAERRGFEPVLRDLHARLGRFEASFASKLTASVNPALPVIDAFVLKNLGLRLPASTHPDRLGAIVATHQSVSDAYAGLLTTAQGQATVRAFDEAWPGTDLHEVKKLDLVLWQVRG